MLTRQAKQQKTIIKESMMRVQLRKDCGSEEEALAETKTKEMKNAGFCPLIAMECNPECVCYRMPYILTRVGKFWAYQAYCSAFQLTGEV